MAKCWIHIHKKTWVRAVQESRFPVAFRSSDLAQTKTRPGFYMKSWERSNYFDWAISFESQTVSWPGLYINLWISDIVIDQMAKPVTKSHKAFDLDDEDLTFLTLGVVAFIPLRCGNKKMARPSGQVLPLPGGLRMKFPKPVWGNNAQWFPVDVPPRQDFS
jgi:hypothetical protein